ncbi:hypothetical protein AGABI2DRAFT_208298 [Agaricus bisporus var. bisporus H97]|uniref:hypothetical protein n=1 Tax=Agaricus bisporus var. bisporus (strain H97 / ATCC MYA-4626 / FGSC 10389) TaxID=936046 RepID=UPI00029F7D51|nr:hypothetical protein AGABI2DRAFT_208298 [Agaricus bisporus var. bisporus H97]EKV45335.1 hypothetical protein AGABI2DRAFT_208298 [Agaricus bisporus var. bisporus H97]
MPPSQTPHRTPLKRVSQGSFLRLSRSGAYPDAPYGLGFLEPALAEFVDETEALQSNVEGLVNLSDSLATFNESFASWLYVMNMNALTTDWPQTPTPDSFAQAKRRAEQAADRLKKQLEETSAAVAAREAELLANKTAMTEVTETDITIQGNTTGASALSGGSKQDSGIPKKKVLKPKMTAKERKERDLEIERIISALPLEFRGSDPNLRRQMETIIEGILKASDQTIKLQDLIKPPDLNQARVNKCLIALVNRKVVQKESQSGSVLYHWRGLP